MKKILLTALFCFCFAINSFAWMLGGDNYKYNQDPSRYMKLVDSDRHEADITSEGRLTITFTNTANSGLSYRDRPIILEDTAGESIDIDSLGALNINDN